jgi:hypothetical protein
LTRPGDVVVVRITRDEATLLLTSLRAPDSSVLAIDVRRLDAPEAVDDASPQDAGPDLEPVLLLHVQNVGDLECRGRWGGRSDENLWIEALSHLVDARAGDVLEYCGVSLIGTQTGWLSGGELCGSRGDGIPLVAFGFRVKDGAAQDFGCTYSGRFLSGQVVGPIEDGRLCRSDRPNDPLVGIDLQLQKRPAAEAQALS